MGVKETVERDLKVSDIQKFAKLLCDGVCIGKEKNKSIYKFSSHVFNFSSKDYDKIGIAKKSEVD